MNLFKIAQLLRSDRRHENERGSKLFVQLSDDAQDMVIEWLHALTMGQQLAN
jgi:hypothetical protein